MCPPKKGAIIKYLIIALINLIYGILTIGMLNRNTPGYFLILFISLVLVIIGLTGLVLYLIPLFQPKNASQKEAWLKNWFQFTKNIDLVLIIGLLFRAFVLQPYIVDGSSMEETYHNNEYLLVDQITYRFREPKIGEVIVFHPPIDENTNYIKRIIGLPGDTVEIQNNTVSVNGHVIAEPFTYPNSITRTFESDYKVTLKEKEYFVMGDNREHSSDSREWGPVPKSDIVGRSWLIVYPFNYFGLVKNPTINI
jgi:signal peptidase I